MSPGLALGSAPRSSGRSAGTIVVDHSTIAPDAARRIAAAPQAHGIEMLDAIGIALGEKASQPLVDPARGQRRPVTG